MAKYILSLDGGGIRGAATARFLALVEETLKAKHGRSLRDCVDFYAGTSTGSFIALALATTDLEMAEISALYNHESARRIFKDNRGWFEIDGFNAPKYEAGGKSRFLKEKFANATIGDVPEGRHVLAMTYSVEKRQPVVIKSSNPTHRKVASWVAADASSAAPTYFPTVETKLNAGKETHWLIDGGVTANNPTMSAIAEAVRAWPEEPLQNFRVLSIGTGYCTRKINGPESQKWGALEWFLKGKILDVLADERVVGYQAHTLISDGNYIRVNAQLKEQPGLPDPPDDAIDDFSRANLRKLKALGEFWFERYGDVAVDFLQGRYSGPSLGEIDEKAGTPKIR